MNDIDSLFLKVSELIYSYSKKPNLTDANELTACKWYLNFLGTHKAGILTDKQTDILIDYLCTIVDIEENKAYLSI